jgi:hypothetical protein
LIPWSYTAIQQNGNAVQCRAIPVPEQVEAGEEGTALGEAPATTQLTTSHPAMAIAIDRPPTDRSLIRVRQRENKQQELS